MTIGVTVAGSTFTTNAGDKTVTATPAVGDLIIVGYIGTSTTNGVVTVSDDQSGTYSIAIQQPAAAAGDTRGFWVRTALVSAAVSTVYTGSCAGNNGSGLIVYRLSSALQAGTGGIRSTSTSGLTGSGGGTPAPVLNQTPLATNAILTFLSNLTNAAGITERTGYTEDVDTGYNSPTTGIQTSHLVANESTATLTFGGTSASNWNVVAIEVSAAVQGDSVGFIPIF